MDVDEHLESGSPCVVLSEPIVLRVPALATTPDAGRAES